MAKLDFDGLSYFWTKAKIYITDLLKGKANSSHTHGDSDITSVDASKIKSGTIDIDRLPQGALERCVVVADDTERFKLTTTFVQKGDTVKVISTKTMYFVVDDTKLSSEAGYEVYTAGTATSVPWSGVTGKPSSYTPSSHTHDDRYYTESEMNTKLGTKVDLSANGVSKAINQLSTGVSTPSDADYYVSQYAGGGTTTTTYYRRPMSALWNYIKSKADKVYSALGHKHTKAEITDFPSSMPASDVSAWAKASTKPSYTKAEIGLGNVDNTADATKSVKYATSAGSATKVNNHTVNADVPANAKFTDTVYTHPTTSGNKHIPSGGSSGQILGWQSDGIAKWIANENSGGYIDLGQFNNNNRTINLDTYKPYAECDSKGDNTTWFVPNDRNCVAWIRSIDNTGTNPPQFGGSEIWFYFRSTMVNGMPLQEIVVYAAVNDGTLKNTYLNRAFCNNAWTSWWGDVDYLKLIGGVMTGPINFSSGSPIQMKPASWTSYVQTLICDGNVKVGVNNFSSFWNNAINLIMLSTAATYIRWKSGNGMYFQAITDSNGGLDTKLAITPDNVLVSYHLPIYEVINGASYRMICVNDSANLHIGGNTSTGNNNISSAILSVLNCQYGFYDTAFRVMEAYDNKVSLGGGYARWKQVYAKNTSISTSDRNLKHDIHDIDDNLIKLFFKIKPKTYYFNDGDRIHIGLIAQDFENSMHELGLSENDYGMICKDILYDYTKFDEDGVPIEDSKVTKKDEDGNIIYRYSFRYEELITLIVQVVHNQQKELDDIRDNIAELNQKLENLK